MKVINTYIIKHRGVTTLLYQCENKWYLAKRYGMESEEIWLEEIHSDEAKQLLTK